MWIFEGILLMIVLLAVFFIMSVLVVLCWDKIVEITDKYLDFIELIAKKIRGEN